MNVNDITFGVEIETTLPAGTAIRVGHHGQGLPIAELPGWKADRDPSIATSHGRIACEFVSGIYKGADGLAQLLADVVKIKAMGATVNASCGLHIHVGFDKSNAVASAKLATLVANFEKAIYATTGTKARERGRWCNGLQSHGNVERALSHSRANRYHVANFGTRLPTVEFRAFGATLNPVKLAAYVRMVVGIVERSLTAKKVTQWVAKTVAETSPIHRNGEGQTAVTRLFYQLGWIKGRQAHTHGDLAADGLPSVKEVKRELMRLAKKYDAQA